MNFANFSPLTVVAGIAVLAASLYLLQRLRLRFREVDVVTILFWNSALDRSPVRTFRQKFRHLWAYLLILLICSLIWIAIAEPEWEGSGGSEFYVLLLDGSASMSREGRFEQALEDLKDDLNDLPAGNRQVIWCGSGCRTLLNPGEHALLLTQRIERLGLKPEATPASIGSQFKLLSTATRPNKDTVVWVYGDADINANLLSQLPQDITVQLASTPFDSTLGNSGITALGIAGAKTGEQGKVDLLFSVASDDAYPPELADIRVTIDDKVVPASAISAGEEAGSYLIESIDSNGGLVKVEIVVPDLLPLDDVAMLRLPNDRPVKVQVSNDLTDVLTPMLAADTGLQLVSEHPDVVIRMKGDRSGGDAPALEFVDVAQQQHAFSVEYPQKMIPREEVIGDLAEMGLGNIDATGRYDGEKKTIEVSVAGSDRWAFSVWRELLSPDYNFIQSRSFPMFMAQSIRWLAGTEQWYHYAAAGKPLVASVTGSAPKFINLDGKTIDTLGARFIPVTSGELNFTGHREGIQISLLDGKVTKGTLGDSVELNDFPRADMPEKYNVLLLVMMMALALVILEWVFYQKGRMP